MDRFYRWLLFLYPASFRREFASEMTLVFTDCCSDAARLGWQNQLSFTAREITGVLRGAFAEHAAAAFGRLPIGRRFNMRITRPHFRFPITAIAFMIGTLALVLAAIRDARVTSDALSNHVYLAGGHAAYHDNGLIATLGAFWLVFAVTIVCAVIALAILHALHRSGTYRLAGAQTWPAER